MTIEYLVLQTLPEKGPFASVIADKVKQSWDTLQDALLTFTKVGLQRAPHAERTRG